MAKQLECRVIITHHPMGGSFKLGMWDPLNERHEYLGTHPARDIERIVGDLRDRIEREGHRVTFSEVTGTR